MISGRKFLVVDDATDTRALLRHTLERKFPAAVVAECSTVSAAISWLGDDQNFDAMVVHRNGQLDLSSLVALLHQVAPRVPIVAMSAAESAPEAFAAGATLFLHSQKWLTLGTVLRDLFGENADRRAALPVS